MRLFNPVSYYFGTSVFGMNRPNKLPMLQYLLEEWLFRPVCTLTSKGKLNKPFKSIKFKDKQQETIEIAEASFEDPYHTNQLQHLLALRLMIAVFRP